MYKLRKRYNSQEVWGPELDFLSLKKKRTLWSFVTTGGSVETYFGVFTPQGYEQMTLISSILNVNITVLC